MKIAEGFLHGTARHLAAEAERGAICVAGLAAVGDPARRLSGPTDLGSQAPHSRVSGE
ncbi:hypothetical protein ACFC96_37645 [Streptomyces sp. NPDC055955]|uniref:hypothetical protein n=1 Tax=Streptomyces sp. NPDC055955 TaxID=3345665 RepID=UPI0035E22202